VFGTRSPGVVTKYYLYMTFNGPGFIYPVYVLYLLANGVTFTQLGVIGAVQAAVTVAGEVPTGYVGDRIGRRNSLALGQVLYVVSTVALLVGERFPVFLAGFVAMSLGRTFVSGSGSAWLYDTLEERLDEDRYTHVRGRGSAVEGWATAATMVAGGVLYVLGPALPFLALLGTRVVTLGTVLWLPRTARYGDDGAGGIGGREVLATFRERLTAPAVRSFVAFMTVVFGATLAVDPFVQPLAVDALQATVGGALSAVGVPEPATLGVLYAAFTAVAATVSDRAGALEERFGARTVVLAAPAVVAVLLVAPLVAPVLVVPMFFAVRGGNALLRPVAERYLNDRVDSAGRASVLSAVSMVYALGRVPFALGSGVVADVASPLAAVAALGVAMAALGGALVVVSTPVETPSTDAREDAAAGG
jgi:MFS family permease